MIRVGLTGGLASGKSTVAKMLAARGAQVADADQMVRALMRPGEPVYRDLVQHFGQGIVQPSGEIDRAALARLAFGDGRVKELNAIVHPAVIAKQDAWMEQIQNASPNAIAVVEAALMLEAGTHKRYDELVVVTCPVEVRVERFAQRIAGSDAQALAAARAEARKRIASQSTDEEKVAVASVVIDNRGTVAETERQVEELIRKLRSRKHS